LTANIMQLFDCAKFILNFYSLDVQMSMLSFGNQ
jgi:hypothetical protein